MYKRTNQGWLKHIDFIFWDVLVLQVSFVLGFMIRHGWGQWPYTTWMGGYKSLGIVLSVVDVLVAIAFNTMHNVMKRGYLKELTASIKHVALVLGMMTLYLFSTQAGDTYSRITMYLTAGFHLILGYTIRLLWKPLIRRINKGKRKDTMILVAEENSIEKILDKASELDGFEYAGIVLSDNKENAEAIEKQIVNVLSARMI